MGLGFAGSLIAQNLCICKRSCTNLH